MTDNEFVTVNIYNHYCEAMKKSGAYYSAYTSNSKHLSPKPLTKEQIHLLAAAHEAFEFTYMLAIMTVIYYHGRNWKNVIREQFTTSEDVVSIDSEKEKWLPFLIRDLRNKPEKVSHKELFKLFK